MHAKLHPRTNSTDLDQRVVYRGDVRRSNCKVGVNGELCGHAKLAYIAANDATAAKVLDVQSLGTPTSAQKRMRTIRDFADHYRHALVMENFCGWNAQLKAFLWLNIAVFMQE